MTYALALDMLDRFGDTEMAQLAAPQAGSPVTGPLLRLTVTGGDRSAYSADDIAAADAAAARVDQALADGAALMDSYLAPRYPLPLDAVLVAGSNLAQVCGDIARYNLMDDRPTEDIEHRYDRRLSWLRDVAAGRASLGGQDTATAAPTGRTVTRDGVSRHDWETY